MAEMRNVYRILVGKSEVNRRLGRPRRRWEDTIRMVLREIGWEVVDWTHVGQYRDQWRTAAKTVMNIRVP
jgi:hypothetical protein